MVEKARVVTSKEGDILILEVLNKNLRETETIESLSGFLLAALAKGAEPKIVIDLTVVEHLTSAMIGKLVQFKKQADKVKAKIRIAGLRPELMKIFQITKMDSLFDWKSDRAKAVKSLRP